MERNFARNKHRVHAFGDLGESDIFLFRGAKILGLTHLTAMSLQRCNQELAVESVVFLFLSVVAHSLGAAEFGSNGCGRVNKSGWSNCFPQSLMLKTDRRQKEGSQWSVNWRCKHVWFDLMQSSGSSDFWRNINRGKRKKG